MLENKYKIAIIGLGYVGLPLAIEFAKKYKVIGFDINNERVLELKNGIDYTNEIDNKILLDSINNYKINNNNGLFITSIVEEINSCNIFIVTVPTPIDKFKRPLLEPLFAATEIVGSVLKKHDIVIYESTVYPGVTEEECVPLLEKKSTLKYNVDFFVGYSPERINPGDKIHTISRIMKVTSGSNYETAEKVDLLYKSIITAGTYKAKSIKVAEASKAIENAQRDINISFVNELALIFDKIGIDTNDVLDAASTKWNFLRYQPGLVGGHCIGVDPYYLAYKAESLGYHPQVILSGRRVNDMMGMFIANKVLKLLINKGHKINTSRALILGVTFKENCPDIRNSKVIDIYKELIQFNIKVDVYDPFASKSNVKKEYGIDLIDNIDIKYDAIILAVSHNEFLKLDLKSISSNEQTVIFDIKSFFERSLVDARL